MTRKVLLTFLVCLISLASFCQTPVTVTGVVQDAGGNLATSGTVVFTLQPQNTGITYFVSGVGTLAPQTATCGIDGTGNVKNKALSGACQIWGVDVITPANLTYQASFFPNGKFSNAVSQLCITGTSFNLNAPVFCPVVKITPQVSVLPVPPVLANLIPVPDNTFTLGTVTNRYSNVFATNGTFTNLSIPQNLTVTGNATIGGTLAVTGVTTLGTSRFGDGSVTTPSIAFTNSTTTGFYKVAGQAQPVLDIAGVNNILWLNGIQRLKSTHTLSWSSASDPLAGVGDIGLTRVGIGILGTTTNESGTLGGGFLATNYFVGATDTSLSRSAANTVQVGATAGVPDASGTLSLTTLSVASAGLVKWSTDTGLSRTAAGTVGVGNGTQGDTSGTVKALNVIGTGSTAGGSAAGIQTIATNGASLAWEASSAAADQKWWDAQATTTALNFRAVNDAQNTVNSWLVATRGAGATVSSVEILPTLQLGSSDTGLSRTAAATVAVGNGTAGDVTGTLKAATLSIPTASNTLPATITNDTAGGLTATSNGGATVRLIDNLGNLYISQPGKGILFFGATSGSTTVVPTAVASGTLTLPAATDTLVGKATADTLTNKRVTPRIQTAADATSITPTSDSADVTIQTNTQIAGTLTINAPTGTPTDGQKLILRIKSTNAQTYSFNATYRFSTSVTAPTGTSAGKTDYIGCIWNATDSKWDVVAVDQGH